MEDEAVAAMTVWVPVSDEDAASIIGEGVHTGLRKGTDAPESGELWRAIRDSDRAWSEALAFLVDGFGIMGVALCEKQADASTTPQPAEAVADGRDHARCEALLEALIGLETRRTVDGSPCWCDWEWTLAEHEPKCAQARAAREEAPK